MGMLLRKVRKYIEDNGLCAKGDRLVVGVSGGADSVALLCLLREMGYSVVAAHCNFCLRGEESDRDEWFVKGLCARLGVELHVRRFDTRAYAAREKVSVEMAARDLRYGWFDTLLDGLGAVAVAVAHHCEDNAETVLLNLIRGTGIAGLCGMQPKNGRVIRPLLDVGRADIEDYLGHIGQPYVTDSTNLEDNCVRNKIRLDILPEMQAVNPSVISSIVETAARLNEAKRLVDKQMESAVARCKLPPDNPQDTDGFKLNIHQLQCEVSPRLLLYKVLSPYGFNSTQIEEIFRSLTGDAGKLFTSPAGWTLLKDRHFLLVRRGGTDAGACDDRTELSVDAGALGRPVAFRWGGLHLRVEARRYAEGFVIPHKKTCACLDADALQGRLYIRRWRQGDRFRPFGMKGTKLVSDYMTDCKFSLFRKQEQCVLVDGDGRIVWLVGERIDDRCKVSARTRRLLLVEVMDC